MCLHHAGDCMVCCAASLALHACLHTIDHPQGFDLLVFLKYLTCRCCTYFGWANVPWWPLHGLVPVPHILQASPVLFADLVPP
jgi:hypothetical protein